MKHNNNHVSPFAEANPNAPLMVRIKQTIRRWRYTRKANRSKYGVYLKHIPEAVYTAWKTYTPKEFATMPLHDDAWFTGTCALMQYFRVAKDAKQQTLLPSAAADSVWHAWLWIDERGLKEFQMKFFKRTFEHVEKEKMGLTSSDHEQVMNETWFRACKDEGLNPLHAALPTMFQADTKLGYREGWCYEYDRKERKICYSHDSSSMIPTAIGAAALVSMGYVSAQEYEAYNDELKKAQESSSGSSCGVGYGMSTGSDGGCSDSGSCSDGGSSCGSSCGGGCGGD